MLSRVSLFRNLSKSNLCGYHSIPYLHTLDVMQSYFSNPYFLEAKAKNYINFNDFQHIQKDNLKETCDALFSKENAPATLTALDRGYFTVCQLASAQPKIRNAYLDAMFKNEANSLENFEKMMHNEQQAQNIDDVVSRFTRKK
jgi:hypothetical protein